MAQFSITLTPLAFVAAKIAFSVAPTDIEGNLKHVIAENLINAYNQYC